LTFSAGDSALDMSPPISRLQFSAEQLALQDIHYSYTNQDQPGREVVEGKDLHDLGQPHQDEDNGRDQLIGFDSHGFPFRLC
jgi:hypothetical protein